MDKPVKLAGFSAATPLARQLIASKPTGMISMERVPMLAVFTLEAATFDFVGARHVPQLRLEGRLDRLIPGTPQEMPYCIGEIGLSAEESIRVVGDYPFNVEQLCVLVNKGLYMEGFGPPEEEWVGLPFEVDTNIDLRILPPNRDGAPPLTIVDLSPMHFFDMSLESSQYELAEHFPDYRGSLVAAGKVAANEAQGVDPTQTQGQDLAGFSFGRSGRDELDSGLVTGGKGMIDRLSALLDVDLTAHKALRGLREDMRGDQIRADKARANLVSPGFAELYGEVAVPARSSRTAAPSGEDELSRAAEQLDSMDLDDLDLSGFSFGDEEDTPVAPVPVVEAPAPPSRLSTVDPIIESVIAENENDGFSFGDLEEDEWSNKARKARLAREAGARQSRHNQQQGSPRHLPEANLPPTSPPAIDKDGPQLGG